MVGDLSESELDELLATASHGHLGCHAGGRTYIVPIGYAYVDGNFVGQTTPGLKVEMMRENPEVCVQVDEIRSLVDWRSAVVWGRFEELDGAERAAAMGALIDRYGSEFGESQAVRQGREVVPPRLDGHPEPLVVYRIRIREKTGRYEKPD